MPDSANTGELAAPALVGGAPLYLTGEDALRLTVLNAHAAVTVLLRGRFLPVTAPGDPPARVGVFEHNLVPATDRTASTLTRALGEGWLLDASIIASAGSPPFGRCYAILSVARGLATSGIELSTLAQGYVTGTQRIGYPGSPLLSSVDGGGALRSITGAVPALGAELAETVPTGARWELLALRTSFTASVAVANRTPSLVADDGATIYGRWPVQSLITANAIVQLTWSPGASGISPIPLTCQMTAIGVGLKLTAGHRLRTQTSLIDAGDQYSLTQYLVREWIEGA